MSTTIAFLGQQEQNPAEILIQLYVIERYDLASAY